MADEKLWAHLRIHYSLNEGRRALDLCHRFGLRVDVHHGPKVISELSFGRGYPYFGEAEILQLFEENPDWLQTYMLTIEEFRNFLWTYCLSMGHDFGPWQTSEDWLKSHRIRYCMRCGQPHAERIWQENVLATVNQ